MLLGLISAASQIPIESPRSLVERLERVRDQRMNREADIRLVRSPRKPKQPRNEIARVFSNEAPILPVRVPLSDLPLRRRYASGDK